MANLQLITCAALEVKLIQNNLLLFDIRDLSAYQKAHLPQAQHLTLARLNHLSQILAKTQAITVYCYHGISSQKVAQDLLVQGFDEIYSLIGGFAAWQENYPYLLEVAD